MAVDLIRLAAGRVAPPPELVRAMIAGQFPQLAELNVQPVARPGWDNASFRLGDDLLVRLPTAEHYAAQVAIEQQWLPWLAPQLPLPIPQPVAFGQPTADFPWPWSIYRWLPGAPADGAAIADQNGLASDLAAFLTALHKLDAHGGPPPCRRNFHRGGPLAIYDQETRTAIAVLGAAIDGTAALACWQAALATPWTGPARWLHGDIAPDNLLVRGGRLAAVIDFGGCAVGDPACDLAIAWRWFDAPARRIFLDGCGLDAATIQRGAAWALWKALIVLAGLPGTNPAGRDQCQAIIASILAEVPG
ncbi:aminoglycoside phosphotransferase family protein [Sandarakinorhabdus sp.]|uniref:aminoglycoside phosphotransferase family protein n=1 Tax=Sandarakinorhabdus sp. TaxID=1916663 RepID=UPI00333FA18D